MATSTPPTQDPFTDGLERHRPGLVAYLRRRLDPGTLVEDAVQETFLRALQKRDQFDPRRALGPWILRVAAHVTEDQRRRERRRRAQPLAVDPPTSPEAAPQVQADQRETLHRLRGGLASLEPTAREVFVCFHQQGLSIPDIAHRLHLPSGTVKSHLHRARRRLAALLQNGGTE